MAFRPGDRVLGRTVTVDIERVCVQVAHNRTARIARFWQHRHRRLAGRGSPVCVDYHLTPGRRSERSIEDWARLGGGLLQPDIVPLPVSDAADLVCVVRQARYAGHVVPPSI